MLYGKAVIGLAIAHQEAVTSASCGRRRVTPLRATESLCYRQDFTTTRGEPMRMRYFSAVLIAAIGLLAVPAAADTPKPTPTAK